MGSDVAPLTHGPPSALPSFWRAAPPRPPPRGWRSRLPWAAPLCQRVPKRRCQSPLPDAAVLLARGHARGTRRQRSSSALPMCARTRIPGVPGVGTKALCGEVRLLDERRRCSRVFRERTPDIVRTRPPDPMATEVEDVPDLETERDAVDDLDAEGEFPLQPGQLEDRVVVKPNAEGHLVGAPRRIVQFSGGVVRQLQGFGERVTEGGLAEDFVEHERSGT